MGLAPWKVAQIAAKNAPVLCMDTCSILDLMRDPTRYGTTTNDTNMSKYLLECIDQHAPEAGTRR